MDRQTYLDTVRAADTTAIARWRTRTCPECQDILTADGQYPDGHVVVNGAVVIGCEGYYVIDPAALGQPDPHWADWTADYDDYVTCQQHGRANVMDWGTRPDLSSYVTTSCGCDLPDNSTALI
jgi:hypothetical protein